MKKVCSPFTSTSRSQEASMNDTKKWNPENEMEEWRRNRGKEDLVGILCGFREVKMWRQRAKNQKNDSEMSNRQMKKCLLWFK